MPIAYAVTYIFGTVGSAILLAQIGPKLLGIDLVAACKAYEARSGGTVEMGGAGLGLASLGAAGVSCRRPAAVPSA